MIGVVVPCAAAIEAGVYVEEVREEMVKNKTGSGKYDDTERYLF